MPGCVPAFVCVYACLNKVISMMELARVGLALGFQHDPGAIECFLLVAFLAYNIFHAFLARNVKPAARQSKTQIFWAKLIAAELYGDLTPAGMPP